MAQPTDDAAQPSATEDVAARLPWSAPSLTAVAIDVVTGTFNGPQSDAATLGSN
jgi:hypothetical protein